jgi:hypothetical protein
VVDVVAIFVSLVDNQLVVVHHRGLQHISCGIFTYSNENGSWDKITIELLVKSSHEEFVTKSQEKGRLVLSFDDILEEVIFDHLGKVRWEETILYLLDNSSVFMVEIGHGGVEGLDNMPSEMILVRSSGFIRERVDVSIGFGETLSLHFLTRD